MAAPGAGSSPNRALTWWVKGIVPVVVALISVLGAWLATRQSGSPRGPETPPVHESRTIRGRVLDEKTVQPLAGARVELELPAGVQPAYTDSLGAFQFEMPAGALLGSFRLRVAAEGYEIHLQEMSGELGSHLSDIRLRRLAEPPPRQPERTGAGGREPSPPASSPLPFEATISEGGGTIDVPPLQARLSVRFLVQLGHQTAVFTLVGPGIAFNRAALGPGAVLPFKAASGDYELTVMSWDVDRRRATVVLARPSSPAPQTP